MQLHSVTSYCPSLAAPPVQQRPLPPQPLPRAQRTLHRHRDVQTTAEAAGPPSVASEAPRCVQLSVHCCGVQDYSTGKPVTIHYPPSQYLDDSTRRSVLADLPGLKLPKSVLLSKDPGGDGSAASRRFRNNTHRLILRIHNKAGPAPGIAMGSGCLGAWIPAQTGSGSGSCFATPLICAYSASIPRQILDETRASMLSPGFACIGIERWHAPASRGVCACALMQGWGGAEHPPAELKRAGLSRHHDKHARLHHDHIPGLMQLWGADACAQPGAAGGALGSLLGGEQDQPGDPGPQHHSQRGPAHHCPARPGHCHSCALQVSLPLVAGLQMKIQPLFRLRSCMSAHVHCRSVYCALPMIQSSTLCILAFRQDGGGCRALQAQHEPHRPPIACSCPCVPDCPPVCLQRPHALTCSGAAARAGAACAWAWRAPHGPEPSTWRRWACTPTSTCMGPPQGASPHPPGGLLRLKGPWRQLCLRPSRPDQHPPHAGAMPAGGNPALQP